LGNGRVDKYDYKVLVFCREGDRGTDINDKIIQELNLNKYFDKIYKIPLPLVKVVNSYKELNKFQEKYRKAAIILQEPDPLKDDYGYILVKLGLYEWEKALEEISQMPEDTIKVFILGGHGFPGPFLGNAAKTLEILERFPGKGNNSYWIISGCGAYKHVENEMIPIIPNAVMLYSPTDSGDGMKEEYVGT